MVQFLFEIALAGSALAVLALGTLAVLGRCDSRIRDGAAALATWLLFAVPLLGSWLKPRTQADDARIGASATASTLPDASPRTRPVSPVPGKEAGSGAAPARETLVPSSRAIRADWLGTKLVGGIDLAAALCWIWAFGTLIALVRLGLALFAARRLRRVPGLPPPTWLMQWLQAKCRRLQMPVPEFKLAERGIAPLSLGGRRGAIVFPARALALLNRRESAAVLVHELTHLRERHHSRKQLAALLGAIHWWNPLVRALLRIVDRIQEHVCDDAAVEHLGNATRYGQCLVGIAQLDLDPRPAWSTGIHPIASGFEERLRRLLGARGFAGRRLARRRSRSLEASLYGCFSVILAWQHSWIPDLALQDKPASRASSAAMPDQLLPLAPNMRWKYRAGAQGLRTITALGAITVAGSPCWELNVTGSAPGWQYLARREDGWHSFTSGGLADRRGVEPQELHLLLPNPLVLARTWEWEEVLTVQVEAGPDGTGTGPSQADLRTKHSLRVDALDEVVTVPAGTFACVRTSDTMTGTYYGRGEHLRWFAPGVGLVREVHRHERWSADHVVELVEFRAGEIGFDAEAVLRKVIGLGPEVRWFDGEPFGSFRNQRFARVGAGLGIWRVSRDAATRFDPASPAAWTTATGSEALEPLALVNLARCCALLVAGSHGDDPQLERQSGGGEAQVQLSGSRTQTATAVASTATWRGEVTIHSERGEIRRIDVRPLAPAKGR